MNTTDSELGRNARLEKPGAEIAGLALPRRHTHRIFPGWGPKLLTLALAVSAISLPGRPVFAASTSDNATSCTTTDRAASVDGNPIAEWPDSNEINAFGGYVQVQVDVNAAGHLDHATIARSSGNASLDREALRVANKSTYAPAISDCQPVASSALYDVNFDPNQ